MLENLVVGWEEIEPIFLTNIALNKPFILLGRHGTCKTTCAKEISKIHGEKSFRFYDATKDDLISIAGIPIPQKLAQGKLEFSEHDRSIWKAKVIVIDELTRANRENQNLWLEILEEKTCFGKKLCYDVLIATMNPESYAATFKLDEALLDRFYAVVPVPDLQKGTKSNIFKKVIQMNLKEQTLNKEETTREISQIRKTHGLLSNNETIVSAVSEYVSNYIEILLNKVDCYVSPRKTIHLVEEIIGLSAYFKVKNLDDYLAEAAKTALLYVLGIPLKIKPEILNQLHSNLKEILLQTNIDTCAKIRIELAKLIDDNSAIQYLKRNIKRIDKHLPFDETEKLLAQTVEATENKNLLLLKNILDRVEGHDEQKRIVEARIVFYEMDAIKKLVERLKENEMVNDNDLEFFTKIKEFVQCLKRFPLDTKLERFLFSNGFDKKDRIIDFVKKGDFDGRQTEIGSGM